MPHRGRNFLRTLYGFLTGTRHTVGFTATMQTVTELHSADVAPAQLNAVLADYVAVDQARIYRRLFVTRFGVLASALGTIGFAFDWRPVFAVWFSVAACAVAPAWAWIAEFRCQRRLATRLSELPEGATHVVCPPGP